MSKILTGLGLICLLVLCSGHLVFGQTAHPTTSDSINGYPADDYYYTTIVIPSGIEDSERPEDQVNVAIHYKIVAYEKANQRPFKSLDKLAMEDLLNQFHTESVQELGLAPASQTPEPEYPPAKPALIGTDEER